jgi:hypothetical protein
MNEKRKILYVALIFGLIRLVLLFYHNPNLIMNIDEESNYEVATNHYKGRGYTYYDSEKKAYLPTAFHASFTIFVYENVLLKHHIHKRYWVVFCNVFSAFLLAVSIFYFYGLCKQFLSEKLVYYATITYCVFPSVIYYIGTLFWYEQIVLSLLIIVVSLILTSLKHKLSLFELILLAIGIILSSLLRIQTIAILGPFLLFMIGHFLLSKQFKRGLIFISIFTLGILSHVPSLVKNKNIYGKYVLSTQTGYEILQGHNPYAKGSWMGNWLLPSSPLYQYSHLNIPNLKNLNQYEEGIARGKLAWDWIKENPLDELKISMRKLLLFFLPRNFEFLPLNQFPNPINFFVYAGFLFFLMLSLKRKGSIWTLEKFILLIPIIGSIMLTLVFFMGARWRYYAEPFMIIFTFMALQEVLPQLNFFKNKFDAFQK